MLYSYCMEGLAEHILKSISSTSTEVREDFLTRFKKGKLLRSDDPVTHYCVFFVPFIASRNKVFLGHHTKANAWIAPGGHIEPEHRSPEETVIQEAREELGVEVTREKISKPFYLSAVDVLAPNRACRRHYSIWYMVNFDQEESFTIEEREFYDTKWLSLPEAKEITNQENRDAFVALESLSLS